VTYDTSVFSISKISFTMEKKDVHSIPVLFTRGTNYQVGYNIGKTFGSLIHDFLNDLESYKKISLPLYSLPEGKLAYENVLNICKAQFPQYVEEIHGMADGAGLPFHKLFILHVEYLMTASESGLDNGCTDIMVNNEEVVMGHTEDAYPECHGRTYIVQAEVLDQDGNVIEQFSSISYPGFLPGYTMGYNQHGMMHSVNTVNPAKRNPNGTPREFIARALLGAETLEQALNVLRNPSYGIADGFNINMYFAKQMGPQVVYSVEVGPGQNGKKESELDILEVPVNDSYFHCNRFVRLPIENAPNYFVVSTDFRNKTLKTLPKARNISDVRNQLSDTSNSEWPVYRIPSGNDHSKTVLTGIFETSTKSWYLYAGPAATSNPVAILHMNY